MSPHDAEGGRRPPEKRDWRSGGKVDPSTTQRPWEQNQDKDLAAEANRKNRKRRVKALIFSGLALLLLGLLIAYMWPRPVTPVIAAVVTEYEYPVPPNAWALEDFERLTASGEAGPFWSRSDLAFHKPTLGDSRDSALEALDNQFEELRVKGLGRKIVVVYLAAHGVVDPKGEPCLLLSTPDPDDPDAMAWLPVRDLLEKLHDAAQGATVFLMLDSNRFTRAWGLGVFYNGFAERLRQVTSRAASDGIENVWVLNSTSEGEIGHVAPLQFGGSVFGYFVHRGLHGYDDAPGDDSAVTIREFRDYVRKGVARWTRDHRFDIQRPLFLPEVAEDDKRLDQSLAYRESEPDANVGDPKVYERFEEAAEPHWNRLAKLWPRYEAENAGDAPLPSSRLKIANWERLQARLLYWEQAMLAGKAYESRLPDLAPLFEELERTPQAPLIPGQGDTVERRRRGASLLEDAPPASDALLGSDAGAAELANEIERSLDDDPMARKLLDLAAVAPYQARFEAAWRWLSKHASLQPKDLSKAVEFVGRPTLETDTRNIEPVEWRWVRMLARWASIDSDAESLRKSLDWRRKAEQAAAPADPRVVEFIKPLVASADIDRRLAEDRLLVGPNADYRHPADDALAKYDQALRWSQVLAHALQARDEALVLTPVAIEWATQRPDLYRDWETASASQEEVEHRERWLRQARDLANEARNLEKLFDEARGAMAKSDPSSIADRPDWLVGIEKQTQTLDQAITIARAEFESEIQQAGSGITAATGAEKLRRLEGLLAISATPDRQALWRTWIGSDDAGQRDTTSGGEVDPATGDVADKRANRFREDMAAWKVFPAGWLFEDGPIEIPAPPISNDSIADESRIASEIRELASAGARWRAVVAQAIDSRDENDDAKKPSLTALDFATRSRAAFCAAVDSRRDPSPADAPPERRWREAWSRALAWQAYRAIDDGWGNGASFAPGEMGDPRPYFDRVASNYLGAAKQLPRESEEETRAWDELEQRLAERKQVIDQGLLGLWVAGSRPNNDATDPATSASVPAIVLSAADAKSFPTWTKLTAAPGLGSGEMALFARSPDGSSPALARSVAATAGARMAVPLPGDTEAQETTVQRGAAPAGGWEIAAIFRDHLARRPFDLIEPKAGRAIVNRSREQPTRVTVKGDDRDPGAVVFVLDCSGSMGDDKVPKKNWPMTKARDALEIILQDLSLNGKYRAGLWLFGHRRGRKNGKPTWREKWGADDANIQYANDIQEVVELVGPTGALTRLDATTFPQFKRKLDNVDATGGTPLYAAMLEAMRSLGQGGLGGKPKRLVVLTDGENEEHPKNSNVILAALANIPGLEVELIGFGNAAGGAALPDLADKSKNRIHYSPLKKIDDLRDRLRQLLGIYGFQVVAHYPDGSNETGKELKLNSRHEISARDGAWADRYEVKLVGKDVKKSLRLKMGECPELYLKEGAGAPRLIHKRYAEDEDPLDDSRAVVRALVSPFSLGDSTLADPMTMEAIRVAWHRPAVEGNGARFRISFQNENTEEFSPRPEETWIEITPMPTPEDQSEGAPYFFHDAPFEAERSAPVVNCLAQDWPTSARRARLDIWTKMKKTDPDSASEGKDWRTVRVEKVDEGLEANPSLTLRPAAGVEIGFGVVVEQSGDNPVRVRVIEYHADLKSLIDHPVRVSLDGAPTQIERVYHYDLKQVEHAFDFQGLSADQVRRRMLHLITRDAWAKDAAIIRGDPKMIAEGW